jgi:hypothetical protein
LGLHRSRQEVNNEQNKQGERGAESSMNLWPVGITHLNIRRLVSSARLSESLWHRRNEELAKLTEGVVLVRFNNSIFLLMDRSLFASQLEFKSRTMLKTPISRIRCHEFVELLTVTTRLDFLVISCHWNFAFQTTTPLPTLNPPPQEPTTCEILISRIKSFETQYYLLS